MKACDAVKTQYHGRDNGRRAGQAAVSLVSGRLKGLGAVLVVSLAWIIFVSLAQAQPPPSPKEVCKPGEALIDIPEVNRSEDGKLSAVLMLSDEDRGMWDNTGRCEWQHLRYFKGWNADDYWNAAKRPPPWPPIPKKELIEKELIPDGQPIPGPTLRARIGDRIEISFMNHIDYTAHFPMSLDKGEGGCDKARGEVQDPNDPTETKNVDIYPRNDKMPNCLHGSSTSNLHFHGTHTTPSTTGDNVLLYIRPTLRGNKDQIEPTDAVVKNNFDEIFKACARDGSPTGWNQLPKEWKGWQDAQEALLRKYDATAPYKGIPGNLPENMKLWPKNEEAIKDGLWPQYSVGAFPYCFKLPDKPLNQKTNERTFRMGQAPGTHWYHAHKHGSTALNVGNGMTGAFIIEGPYDDELQKAYYKQKYPDRKLPEKELEEKALKEKVLKEKVLVIQQLETSLNMLSAAGFPGSPLLSVNGRREPVIEMQPGQIQLWRIVNGAARSFVKFVGFGVPAPTKDNPDATTPCSSTKPPCVEWRQTAQDGVQLDPRNYGKNENKDPQFNMAGANRVDLLVKAPQKGTYKLRVWESVIANPRNGDKDRESILLTVKVTGLPVSMGFIDKGSFPEFPAYLKDIPKEDVSYDRPELVFDTTPGPARKPLTSPDPVLPSHTINGKPYTNEVIDQTMGLNTIEEWTLVNKAVGIAHPFHIHINPFQVVEVFDPNSAKAKDPGPCYADPKDPTTWDPTIRKPDDCTALPEPFVWWDTLAIPSASERAWDWKIPKTKCNQDPSDTTKFVCPLKYEGAACSLNETDNQQQCTVPLPSAVKIPGYFKMRSRFADFLGQFVQHCHILGHEDRGMMQLIQIAPKRIDSPQKSGYTHD